MLSWTPMNQLWPFPWITEKIFTACCLPSLALPKGAILTHRHLLNTKHLGCLPCITCWRVYECVPVSEVSCLPYSVRPRTQWTPKVGQRWCRRWWSIFGQDTHTLCLHGELIFLGVQHISKMKTCVASRSPASSTTNNPCRSKEHTCLIQYYHDPS